MLVDLMVVSPSVVPLLPKTTAVSLEAMLMFSGPPHGSLLLRFQYIDFSTLT